ncbi:MAG: hypothetical protein WC979_01945 [Candidatus Pacearchaeota archaeon]|jgi:calcineurin-like phosphoesterase family protein|nr:metallophosphoesterase family protein [Clostridia bacterium]
MIYFTSDTHFGDDRLNLYGRDLVCKTSEEMDNLIIDNWNSIVTDDDTVYHLGDVAMNEESLKQVLKLNGKKILIKGNYDDKIADEVLLQYFSAVHKNLVVEHGAKSIPQKLLFLNHYPTKADDMMFNIVGHIHGLWKVQRNTINVGCDAWHFKPISMDLVLFSINGINKFYDQNVFAGEIIANLKYAPKESLESIKTLIS